jgi:hypothetical protein
LRKLSPPDLFARCHVRKARQACEAALRDRHRLEHELKMAKMENARLTTAVALHCCGVRPGVDGRHFVIVAPEP